MIKSFFSSLRAYKHVFSRVMYDRKTRHEQKGRKIERKTKRYKKRREDGEEEEEEVKK